jgi:hypothetical protein
MASGILQRFQGKIKAAQIFVGSSTTGAGFYDAASGFRMAFNGGAKLSLPVTATANTDFTLSLPTGASVISANVFTSTAYGAATDCTIQIGSAAAGSQYVAATSIKAQGAYLLTFVAGAYQLGNLPAAPNLFIRLVQTGTASATGAAILVIEYVIN